MFWPRLISALVILPVVFGAVYVGGVWFAAVIGLFAIVAGWEFDRMMKAGGYQTALFIILGLILLLILRNLYTIPLTLDLLVSGTILITMVWFLFKNSPNPIADWSLTLAGALYLGFGLGYLVGLRELENGLSWVLLAGMATWGADTLAYFAGKNFGQHLLWPRHSPKKTWEGLIGGMFGGVIGAAIVIYFSPLGWGTGLVVGLIVPIVAFFGDVSISMMKRHVGIKDTSQLIPGHGGVLDRVDSFLFVSVVVYHYAVLSG